MSVVLVEQVKAFVLSRLEQQLPRSPNPPDDFDLMESGILDSLAMVDLIVAVECEFGVAIDFTELDPEKLTIIGPFCQYVAERSGAAAV